MAQVERGEQVSVIELYADVGSVGQHNALETGSRNFEAQLVKRLEAAPNRSAESQLEKHYLAEVLV